MNKVIRFLFAMVVGVFMTAFAFGVSTVSAAENQTVSVSSEQVEIDEADVAQAESAGDEGSSGMFLLMGGMLLIILAVVISVVATFVVTAPIADEV